MQWPGNPVCTWKRSEAPVMNDILFHRTDSLLITRGSGSVRPCPATRQHTARPPVVNQPPPQMNRRNHFLFQVYLTMASQSCLLMSPNVHEAFHTIDPDSTYLIIECSLFIESVIYPTTQCSYCRHHGNACMTHYALP